MGDGSDTLVLLALAMASVVFLITDVLFGTGLAAAVGIVVVGFVGGVWFAIPLSRRARGGP